MKKLPIGVQSIEKILTKSEYVYIDKTDFIKELMNEGAPYFFISRPRRFGKSLFLNTLQEVFSGNKELFKECEIYRSDYDWKKHPVVSLDFSKIANSNPDELKTALKIRLEIIAKEHDVSIITADIQVALDTLVVELSKKYKRKVVVLIDEYDKPIIDHLDDLSLAQKNKNILKGFFGTLKGLDAHLRFIFVTGISKFSRVSLFSGLNNLKDITIDPRYAGIMGYAEEELKSNFQDYIKNIAQKRGNQRNTVSEGDIIDEIRIWYNGYRFSKGDICVYNPFSTLNFMDKQETGGYWYSTGTPSFLIHQLKKHFKSMISLDGTTATEEELMDISSLDQINLEALMYQTGYFTIKDYNPISKRYKLGLPNEEVRSAFINSLVQNFAPIANLRSSRESVEALERHQPGCLFKQIEIGLSSFAYQVFVDATERTYQAILLSMLYGMGFDPLSERTTNTGRIDVLLEVPKTTYILELKLNKSADKALKQIHEKKYFEPYTQKGKQIVIIGANFCSELRNVSEWKGELLSESGEKIRDILPGSGE